MEAKPGASPKVHGRRKIVVLGVGVVVAISAATLSQAAIRRTGGTGVDRKRPAGAGLTSARHDCELFLPVNVTNDIYAADPDLRVVINNGSARRDVVIQLSAEGLTTDGSPTIGVRYSIDGGPFDVHGPEFFISEPNLETHTNMSIVALGPGPHTIVPGYVIWSGEGTGQVLFRCLSVSFGR
jgi:hypothetical protein